METSLYSITRLFVLAVLRRWLTQGQFRESNSLNCEKVMQLCNRYRLPSDTSQLCLHRKVFFQKGKSIHVSPFKVNRVKAFVGTDDNSKRLQTAGRRWNLLNATVNIDPLPALSYLILTITLWNRYCFPHFFRWGQRPSKAKKFAQDNSTWQSWLGKRCPWIQRPCSIIPCSKCPE